LAKGVRASAIGWRIASNAPSRAIANLIVSAARSLRVVRKHRRAIRARVGRARFAIIRKVGVVVDLQCARRPITDDLLAIVCILQNGACQRALALVRDFAFIVDAVPLFALGLGDPDAMTRRRTFDACPIAIANICIAGRTSGRIRNVGILGHAIVTNIERARIVVVIDIGIVVDLFVFAIQTKAQLAIPDDFRETGGGHSIEKRKDALTRHCIARILRARIAIIAIVDVRTRNRTRARFALPGFVPLGTRCTVRQYVIGRFTADTRVGRAGIVVILDVLWIVDRGRFTASTNNLLAIFRLLRRNRRRAIHRLLGVFANERRRGTNLGRTRIFIVAIGIDGARGTLYDGRLLPFGFQRARRNLRCENARKCCQDKPFKNT